MGWYLYNPDNQAIEDYLKIKWLPISLLAHGNEHLLIVWTISPNVCCAIHQPRNIQYERPASEMKLE